MLTVGLLFWILMIVWLVFGVVTWKRTTPEVLWIAGWDVLTYGLFFLLGVGVFGWPIKG